jgi:hypothetical protein
MSTPSRVTIIWLTLAMSGSGAVVGFFVARPARPGNRLEARILDDADGKPLAARVRVTDADGKALDLEGPHAHVQYPAALVLRRRFAVGQDPGLGRVVAIRRGFETRPGSETVDAPPPRGRSPGRFGCAGGSTCAARVM